MLLLRSIFFTFLQPGTVTVPVYKPPLRGAPGGRVGGGTRGTPRDLFVLSALAPDHSGLTVQEHVATLANCLNRLAFVVHHVAERQKTLSDEGGTKF